MKETLINGHTFGRSNSVSVLRRTSACFFLFSAIAALFLFTPPSLYASESLIQKALSELPEKPEKARGLLETLSTDDVHFKIAVEELLKIFYKSQNWGKFFGYAQYYRHRWPASERSEVQLLEALGLLRHCQNESLSRLLHELRTSVKPPPLELEQIEALSQTQFRAKAASQKPPSKLEELAKGDLLWETKPQVFSRVHPSKIQVRVKNECD